MADQNEWAAGDRVRVASRHHWARGATGVIGAPPVPVRTIAETTWPRVVAGTAGPLTFHWVLFDEPQRDAEGDGPYREAEIDSRFLEQTGGRA